MAEYKQKGTVCDIPLPTGLVESGKLDTPLFTPSTKAAIGDHGVATLFVVRETKKVSNVSQCKYTNVQQCKKNR